MDTGSMAKLEYKDRGNRAISRIILIFLLVTMAILGYSYWVLVKSHRETTAKVTFLKADLDASRASTTELSKMMESCKEELQTTREEVKKLKVSESALQTQLGTLQEAEDKLQKDKAEQEEKLKKEIADCQESAKQQVNGCNVSCDQKVNDAKQAAEATCQQQHQQRQQQQNAVPVNANQVAPLKQEGDANRGVQQNPPAQINA